MKLPSIISSKVNYIFGVCSFFCSIRVWPVVTLIIQAIFGHFQYEHCHVIVWMSITSVYRLACFPTFCDLSFETNTLSYPFKHKNRFEARFCLKMFTHCFTSYPKCTHTLSHTHTHTFRGAIKSENLLLIFHIIKSKITSTSITILPLSLVNRRNTVNRTHKYTYSYIHGRTQATGGKNRYRITMYKSHRTEQ